MILDTSSHSAAGFVLVPPVIHSNKPVAEIVEAMSARLDTLGRSERTRQCVPPMLRMFARFHPGPVGELRAQTVLDFIASRGAISPRSKNNLLALVRSVVRFSIRHRYLPKWYDELDALERWTVPPSPVEIYGPEDLRRVLAVASPQIVAGLAGVAFCGLRTAEIHRVTWADVDFERGMIFVAAAKAKTRLRRYCPIPANAREWLLGRAGSAALPLCGLTVKGYNEALRMARIKAGVPLRRNGWRHSFVSCRVALTGDVEQTALEAGNSAAMIHKHYREAVRRETAAEWFNVRPSRQMELPLAA